MNALGLEGEKDLPSASELAEPAEDQPRRLPHPSAWIEPQADLPMGRKG